MRDQPSAAEILEAVGIFLRLEVMPALSGRVAFHTRVAANALDIVLREITLGAKADAAETARLVGLLGPGDSLASLNQILCARISSGELPADNAALIAHLWATTLDAVAIDQPGYATYQRELARLPEHD